MVLDLLKVDVLSDARNKRVGRLNGSDRWLG